jgi:hypothetical protein
MATHQVDLKIPHNIALSNVDHSLRVKRNGTLLGVLTISKGGIDWKRAHARGSVSMSWKAFADLMKNEET